MGLKKLFVLACILLFGVPAYAAQEKMIEGSYEKLPGHEFVYDGKQVEIIEFLSFYCGHCYRFETSIPIIRGTFPRKTKWKTIPIYWGNGSPKPGEAYFIAEEKGRGEEMKKALFDAVFSGKRDIGNIEVLEEIGMKLGLGFDFSRKLRSGYKAKNTGEAILMSKAYGIEETPTLIIAGNLKVTPHGSGSSMDDLRNNAITIIKSILKE